jgi:hypothetical protein
MNGFQILIKSLTAFDLNLRYSRLSGSLTTFEAELDFRIKSGHFEKENWAIEAGKLLERSKEFLTDYKFDEAWKCFHSAKRHEVYGMDKKERIENCKILIAESAKLNTWRTKAIKELIGNPESKNYSAPSVTALIRAMELKDEHYDNIYYQNRLTASLYRMLFIMLAVVSLLIIYFSSSYINASVVLPEHNIMVYGVILFGLLGAITSSILFTRNQAASSRISELTTNSFIVLSKIAVGVGFTLFFYFLLRSSLLDGIQLLNFKLSSDVDYYTIAFVSGFTERIAQKAMGLILGGDEKKQEVI